MSFYVEPQATEVWRDVWSKGAGSAFVCRRFGGDVGMYLQNSGLEAWPVAKELGYQFN